MKSIETKIACSLSNIDYVILIVGICYNILRKYTYYTILCDC